MMDQIADWFAQQYVALVTLLLTVGLLIVASVVILLLLGNRLFRRQLTRVEALTGPRQETVPFIGAATCRISI